MYDVIKMRLKKRDATKKKRKHHLKFGNPSFKIGFFTAVLIYSVWFPFPPLVAIFIFKRIFMTSYMTLANASFYNLKQNTDKQASDYFPRSYLKIRPTLLRATAAMGILTAFSCAAYTRQKT